MSKENQNTEWKSKWRDEYIKWICGFANAEGGKIIIGADDKGNIIGVSKVDKLLEDLPNKIRDILGIMVDVNHKTKDDKDYIEISVESYPSPVSYKGQFHYRSGSTKQELKGPALEKFLLEKKGMKWDGISINSSIDTLSENAFQIFRREAAKGKRVPKDVLEDSNTEVLEELHMFDENKLKRAAVLLFGKDPEKLVTGSFVKIGFFKTDDELLFHNDVHGSLFSQVETTLDLLYTKYFKETISFTKSTRVEDVYPELAIREALLNALTHKDYTSGVPIQISVYNNKVIFWNPGNLPPDWSVDKLKVKHPSLPPNPDVANTFFRCGYIDAWGRGTIKLINECQSNGFPEPIFESDGNGFTLIIRKNIYEEKILKEMGLPDRLVKILIFTKEKGSVTNTDVQKLNGVSKRTATRYLNDLEGKYLHKEGDTGKGTEYYLL